MNDKQIQSFTFIIRASGESTVKNLKTQLSRQISRGDKLFLLDEKVPFEDKLRLGYELAIKTDKAFSVFIDGDILLRSNAVKRLRKITEKLEESDFGFGLKLWDRFYNEPKFRGLHVYNTRFLKEAVKHIPKKGEQLRPETYVKEKMSSKGYKWRNDFVFFVAGLHDFYQRPQDIYYKFLVRSKRSTKDIQELKTVFKSMPTNLEYKVALKGIEDGELMEEVMNDKYLYTYEELKLDYPFSVKNRSSLFVDILIFKRLVKRYKFGVYFWKFL